MRRVHPRRLAGLIDNAAGGPAAERHRRRPLQHFHFLHVERIAIVAAEVAHAVDEKIVARGEAADGQVVALRAAFARCQADARNVAERVAQRGGALLIHHLARHFVDGLRRVRDWLGVFRGRCSQGVDSRGDVHRGRNAADFERYFVRPGEPIIDTRSRQQLFQRLFHRVATGHARRSDPEYGCIRYLNLDAGCVLKGGNRTIQRASGNVIAANRQAALRR